MAYVPVLLDTCVLYPARIRDTLLSLAAEGLYEPLWSADILEELRRNLEARRPPPNVHHLLAEMRRTFPDSEVTGYRPLIPFMTCDPKDAHVLAAAVHAHASVIVTSNLSDFPPTSTAPHGVTASGPDRFALDLFDADPTAVCTALTEQAERRRRTLPALMQELSGRQHLPDFSTAVCRYIATRGW